MRTPEYISPTGLKTYRENREEYYLRYLADTKAPRDSQTKPMSIGSAFDAYIKNHIHEKLFGKEATKGTDYEFMTIFEKQVETQHRVWAREHGRHVFNQYLSSGALADLFLELNGAIGTPRFEFELRGEVRSVDQTTGVTLMGKPDLYFNNAEGIGVSFDWKVNGYCSNSPVSPKKGYVCLKPGWSMHKDCIRSKFHGITINSALTLDQVDADWAAQLSIYSWLCGEEVGSSFVVAIDQVACNTKGGILQYPELRFAQHRLLVSEKFQHDIFSIAKELWTSIQSGHYFTDMSLDESVSRCQMLDAKAKDMWEPKTTPEDIAFAELTSGRRMF